MAEVDLSRFNAGIQRGSENKFRRSLKTLQISADEQGLAVNNLIHPNDKMSSQVKKSEKLPTEGKENLVRRSKRKTAAEKIYAESPEETKVVKSRSKNPRKTKKTAKSTTAKKNVQKETLNQKKLDFTTIEVKDDTKVVKQENENSLPQSTKEEKLNISAIVAEDSGFGAASRVSDESHFNSTPVFHSPVFPADIDTSIITGNNPPLLYWKELAERRRLALEDTLRENEEILRENELLRDQITVLETEISQMREVVEKAEDLAETLKAIID